jgi:hypothetical protein
MKAEQERDAGTEINPRPTKKTGNFLTGFTYLGAIPLVAAGLAMLLRTAPAHPEIRTSEEQ